MQTATYKSYMNEITKYPLLTATEEKDLSKRVMQGDKDAQQLLVNSNLRYVVSLAHKYAKTENSLMDCIQEGNLGLMVAASKFNYTFNTRFSTYANPWIKQYILRHKNLVEPTIHVPALKVEKLRAIKKAHNNLEQRLGKKPSTNEMSIYTGIDEETLREYSQYNFTMCSIEPREENGLEVSLCHVLTDERVNLENDVLMQDERQEYMRLINNLPKKERFVIMERYRSYIDTKHITYKAMGTKLGVSIEATRQIEKRAKKILQNTFESYYKEVYNEKVPV